MLSTEQICLAISSFQFCSVLTQSELGTLVGYVDVEVHVGATDEYEVGKRVGIRVGFGVGASDR